jgi:alkanesulfonate monooxygenase SsuD/methylene tetrahydromethanopterin reductase-like flavin-dependent oxidoreductase (luciferase family)
MREVLLHGGADEAFDRSIAFARRLGEEPLSAGWTAEVSPERMPELHQAMESEARDRLSRFISLEDQERLGVQIALRTGPADEEIVRYTESHNIDLAILQAACGDEAATELSRAVLDRGRCALLVLR